MAHRREAAERRKAWDREAGERRQEWIRQRLFEVYSSAIYYLVKLSASASDAKSDKKDVRQHFSEAQRFLNLIAGYQTSELLGVADLGLRTRDLAGAWGSGCELGKKADDALKDVKALFTKDSRIQVH